MLELDRDRADRQVRTVCLLILAVVALGAALHYLKPVLVPFLFAVFFTHCLTPAIDLQVHYLRVPRLLAILGAAILGLAILGLCGLLVAASVGEIAENYDAYRPVFTKFVENSAQAMHLNAWASTRTRKPEGTFPSRMTRSRICCRPCSLEGGILFQAASWSSSS
jgi:AI-2 transport protein TqsA